MSKIIISADSTCDLSQELIETNKIKILPMIVNFGLENFRDNINLTPDEIYARVEKEGVLPKTSAIPVVEYQEFFNSLKENADDIILHFSISSGFSSTYQNSVYAAQEVKNVYSFDSQNLSTGIGLIILKACHLRQEGKKIEEIIEKISEYQKRVDASFLIDSLEYLHKGGRCSSLQKIGASMFLLKPCIEVKNGKMGVGKKFRGRYARVIFDYIESRLTNCEVDSEEAFVTHAGCDQELVEAVVNKVKEFNLFEKIHVTRAGCTISTHCGRNTLGVLFVHKNKKVSTDSANQ